MNLNRFEFSSRELATAEYSFMIKTPVPNHRDRDRYRFAMPTVGHLPFVVIGELISILCNIHKIYLKPKRRS